jgi:asparagine synthase (glutamine-hydrolysing)
MCGIAAVVCFTGQAPEEPLRRLLGKMRHRGVSWCQEETGRWGNVALGTNRLPVESQYVHAQPRTGYSGKLHAVYNGEVYNWRKLLTAADCRRKGGGIVDETQVVIDCLGSMGEQAFAAFDGMYALVAYDEINERLLIARDPFGIKPLYYGSDRNNLYVASELKAIAHVKQVKEVFEAKPGYLYTLSTREEGGVDGLVGKGYWSYPVGEDVPVNPVGLLQELERAVAECLATDKGVAIHLSGGVDSSGILALALQSRKDVRVVSIGKSESLDMIASRGLAKEFGIELFAGKIPEEEELFDQVPDIIAIVESFEPNVIRQSSAHYYLALAARDVGATVILCGEGADEVFGGYPEFLAASESEFFSMRRRFLDDLYRTQLQRVDRMSMRFTLETRVPFLRKGPVMCALSSRHLESFVDPEKGLAGTKRCLREALRGIVPEQWRLRPKVVLSEGMGLGGNDPLRGMFSRIAQKAIRRDEVIDIRKAFPEWKIETAEEAFYFREFHRLGYTKLRSSMDRVYVNRINSSLPLSRPEGSPTT